MIFDKISHQKVLEARKQWTIFKMQKGKKKKKLSTKNPNWQNCPSNFEGKIHTFLEKQQFRDFFLTIRCALQELLKGVI